MPGPKRSNSHALWQSIIKPNQSLRQFENEIIQFHIAHRTPLRQLPYVLGRKVNLRKLLVSVLQRGGYKRVNERAEWEDVVADLNLIPGQSSQQVQESEVTGCTNCELALQSVYCRYLEQYERAQWTALQCQTGTNSSMGDDNSNSLDAVTAGPVLAELSQRDKSFLAGFVEEQTPRQSRHCQSVSGSQRTEGMLSTEMRQRGELVQLRMALRSGLPNEIQLALNALLLLSHASPSAVILDHCDDLLDLIAASAGACSVAPGALFHQLSWATWMHRIMHYWSTAVEDGDGRLFLIPNIFDCTNAEFKRLQHEDKQKRQQQLSESLLCDEAVVPWPQLDPVLGQVQSAVTVLLNLTDSVGGSWTNCRAVTRHCQSVRLLLMGAHSRLHPCLRRLCIQVLARLRFVLVLQYDERMDNEKDDSGQWLPEFLMQFLGRLLSSSDRQDRIAGHEMLQTLCLASEDNQPVLSARLDQPLLAGLAAQLTVPDIHPLCSCLEALVAVSQLSDVLCRRLALLGPALLRVLLHYIQIEAQVFGPAAVYKIRTFNHRPPSLAPPPPLFLPHSPHQQMPIPLQMLPPHPIPNPMLMSHYSQLQQHVPPSLSHPHIARLPSYHTPPSTITSAAAGPSMSPLQHINHLLNRSLPPAPTPTAVSASTATVPVMLSDMPCAVPPLSTAASTPTRVLLQDSHEKQVSPPQSSSPSAVAGAGAVALSCEEDRAQMPPPTQPAPRKVTAVVPPPNGAWPQLLAPVTSSTEVRQLSTEGARSANVEIEDRCGRARAWLAAHFMLSEKPGAAVMKQALVSGLQAALHDPSAAGRRSHHHSASISPPGSSRRVLSSHELHSCIKAVFGSKVQVKVEPGTNGTSRLIYSHLELRHGSKDDVEQQQHHMNGSGDSTNSTTMKPHLNGGPVTALNGVLKSETGGNGLQQQLLNGCYKVATAAPSALAIALHPCDTTTTSRNINSNRATRMREKRHKSTAGNRARLRFVRRLVARRLRSMCKRASSVVISHKEVSKQQHQMQQSAVSCQCEWDRCSQFFSERDGLYQHVVNDHLSCAATCQQQQQMRSLCLWRSCGSGQLARGPLSLLQHVVETHFPATVSMTTATTAGSAHQLSPATQQSPMVPLVMMPEKSGWSVLGDHFRAEQLSGLQSQRPLPEGPITRHIRISSALVLRNLARHSLLAKTFLRSHERVLVAVAMSGQDCSPVVVQCLDELSSS